MFWAILIFLANAQLLCPRSVEPYVITIDEDKYQKFRDYWAELVTFMAGWYANGQIHNCWLIFPVQRFDGTTFEDFEPDLVLKWQSHKKLPITQSHYNLYMSHHKKNQAKPPFQRTHLLVLEEDVRCVDSTLVELSEFLEHLQNMVVEWDLIYIGGMIRDFLPKNSTGGEWLFSDDYFWRPKRIYNIEAYLINLLSLEKIAEMVKLSTSIRTRAIDVILSKGGIERGELIALVPTQRSCIQNKPGAPTEILFGNKDRRWYAMINKKYTLIPLHSAD